MGLFLKNRFLFLICILGACVFFAPFAQGYNGYPHPDRTFIPSQSDVTFIADLQKRTFNGFLKHVSKKNHFLTQTMNTRSGAKPVICISCLGFQLAAYGIGVERHFVTRTQAQMSTLLILRALKALPQNATLDKSAGYKGFFYSYLDDQTGLRADIDGNNISARDNSFLMLGILFAHHYYMQDVSADHEIRRLTGALFDRVDWPFMIKDNDLFARDWDPQKGLNNFSLEGYNEAIATYLLALGSPTHPIGDVSWHQWQETLPGSWHIFQGENYFNAVPLSSHLLAQSWIDFHNIDDDMNRRFHLDYAENTSRAIRAQRQYALHNPMKWKNYSDMLWGLTESDGPSAQNLSALGETRQFLGPGVRGVSHEIIIDDGTVSPAIEAASLPFLPQEIFSSLQGLHAYYGQELDGADGLVSAVNPSAIIKKKNQADGFWISDQWRSDQQGLSLLMIGNYRDRVIWNVMKSSPVICRGLMRAGFRGGWLDRHHLTVDYDDARRKGTPHAVF